MKTACTTAVVVALIAASAAQAQDSYGTYYGYHHRSTALGDWYAGAGELVRAQGAFLKDEAAAAVTWLEVDRGREAFRYEMEEWRQQDRLDRQRRVEAKAEARRSRQRAEEDVRTATAQVLLQDIRDGMPVWPEALQLPKYAGSKTMIESLLRNWDGPMDTSFRSALATELGVLETRIAADTSVNFLQRVEAVRTLRVLMELTEADAIPAHLAMR
ncbi:MAG: hypothetical protein CMJ58_25195 [Planctomycetaceae bacterium]|nr:hypothetical protein [Planctomycetaceae bacterium]